MTLRSSGLGIGKFTIALALPLVGAACSGNVKSTMDTGNDARAPEGNDRKRSGHLERVCRIRQRNVVDQREQWHQVLRAQSALNAQR